MKYTLTEALLFQISALPAMLVGTLQKPQTETHQQLENVRLVIPRVQPVQDQRKLSVYTVTMRESLTTLQRNVTARTALLLTIPTGASEVTVQQEPGKTVRQTTVLMGTSLHRSAKIRSTRDQPLVSSAHVATQPSQTVQGMTDSHSSMGTVHLSLARTFVCITTDQTST